MAIDGVRVVNGTFGYIYKEGKWLSQYNKANAKVEIQKAEFDYYYYSSLNSFASTYGSYLSYFGLDTSKPLDQQQYSDTMTWDDYLHAITLIRSNDLWTLSQGLKLTYLGEVSDWQLINSASTLGTVPMIFVFFFFQKYMIKGLTAGAVKG